MGYSRLLTVLSLISIVVLSGCVCSTNTCDIPKLDEQADFPVVSKNLIRTNCLVTVFKPDGSKYLTEQSHEIITEPATITITSVEPEGDFAWKLEKGNFSILMCPAEASSADIIWNQTIAQTVLTCMTKTGTFIKEEIDPTLEAIKANGKWYYPIEIMSENEQIKQTIFLNRSSSQIDMVRTENLQLGEIMTGRCYNYREFRDSGRFLPTAIDIYSSDVNYKSPLLLELRY
jgi:hypothetical protein